MPPVAGDGEPLLGPMYTGGVGDRLGIHTDVLLVAPTILPLVASHGCSAAIGSGLPEAMWLCALPSQLKASVLFSMPVDVDSTRGLK